MKAERIEQTFNGKVSWIVQGGYFKLLSTVNPVTVELFRGGQRVLFAAQAEGGFYHRTDFDRVEITTGANEAVAWFYGPKEGGQDRFSGAVTILSNAPGRAHTQAAVTAGATSGTLVPANPNRRYLLVQNQDAAESVFINSAGGAAVANNSCLRLGPGEVWEPLVPPTGWVSVIRGGSVNVPLHVIEA